jgi:hypothetical protein
MRQPGHILCLPGHKQVKLWGDALALTGLEAGEQVRGDLDKYFVTPAGKVADTPLPLGKLYFLEERSRTTPTLTPLTGIDRFTHGQAAFYRPHFCAALSDNQDLFAMLARISQNTPMARFDRPKRGEVFDACVDFIAAAIRAGD